MSTTGGSDVEHNNHVGQVSTIMRSLTSRDGDFLSRFDIINEENTLADLNSTPFKQMLFDNHTEPAHKVEIKGHLPLEHLFGFCKTFKKITKNLRFHLTFKTTDLQNRTFTTIATDINVSVNSFYLYVPVIIPNSEMQVMFNESNKNIHTITYDSWYTERKLSTDGNELQVDIGNAQLVNIPKYLIGIFQTETRIGKPNKNNINAIFHNVNVRKYFCEIDGYIYPIDVILTNFTENDYLDQYKD